MLTGKELQNKYERRHDNMGTRYNQGDSVIREEDGKNYEVAKIKEPESDSPTYIIERSGIKKFEKASDLKKETHDVSREQIESTLRDKVHRWSDIAFVRTFSSPMYYSGMERDIDGDMIAVARVNNGLETIIAVDGTYMEEYSSMEEAVKQEVGDQYTEMEKTGKGGRMPPQETEISVDVVVDTTSKELGADYERVRDILEEEYEPYSDVMYWSSSGQTAYYKVNQK